MREHMQATGHVWEVKMHIMRRIATPLPGKVCRKTMARGAYLVWISCWMVEEGNCVPIVPLTKYGLLPIMDCNEKNPDICG
jgi:hypothetical protein